MPSAFRDPKNLPEWLELDFFRRPRSLSRLKMILIWGTLAALLVASAAAFFIPTSTRWLQAGPVSAAHTYIASNCAECHTEALQTPKRFLRWDGTVRAVPNEACSTCHEGPPHNDQQLVELDCAACHREHRGRSILARVPESDCLSCHADLKANHAAGAGCRFEDVTGFPDGHPEFALWQGRDPLLPAGTDPKDPGQLRFNHAVHLAADGVLQPDGTRKKLECASCHQPDEAGRYMRAINYEQHCQACHPLSVRLTGQFPDPALQEATDRFARDPAPHREPALVRAVLRDRLLEFARANRLSASQDNNRQMIFPKPRRPQPVTHQVWSRSEHELTPPEAGLFANAQLAELERSLFRLSGGCMFCHLPEQSRGGSAHSAQKLPSFLATNLRQRWLPHSRFRHAAHRMMQCTDCHDARTSTATADILMPRLETCAGCHNATVGARHDCVECHVYHGRGHSVHAK